MMTSFCKKNKLLLASILYIYIPIFLFLFGWIKVIYALLATIFILYGIYKLLVDYSKDNQLLIPKLNLFVIFTIIGITAIFAYLCGWGGWAPQSGDWSKHNAVMRDLMCHSWPVYYTNSDEHSMLTYYIAQYLVPALMGKLFHSFKIAEFFQYIWGILGLLLVYFNLLKIVNADTIKKQFITLTILFTFSGMLVVAQTIVYCYYPNDIVKCLGSSHWCNVSDLFLQYRSNTVSLRWVYPQCIIAWLVTLLLYEHRTLIQHYIVLLLPAILYGTLSFLGILPIAIGYAIISLFSKNSLSFKIKQIFSISNITNAIGLGSIVILYFYGNILSEKPAEIGLSIANYHGLWLVYASFCFCMFGVYSLLVYHHQKKNSFFWLANIILLTLPWFKLGLYNDLIMCSSIPALFIIMICVIKFVITKHTCTRDNIFTGMLIVCLCIGSLYPLGELDTIVKSDNITKYEEFDVFVTLEKYANRQDINVSDDVKYNYYSYDIENNLFQKYIARKTYK